MAILPIVEVPDARRVFTTFEQPDLKSTFTFTVTAPSHWVVVSNAPTPAPEEVTDSTSVWRFPTTKRMSTYITALIAGEYHGVHDTYEGFEVKTFGEWDDESAQFRLPRRDSIARVLLDEWVSQTASTRD